VNGGWKAVDFGRVAEDYARFRGGFPPYFFDLLAKRYEAGREGQRLLDLGCGTGALANEFARRGCEVSGVDPSENLLEEAERTAASEGLSVRYAKGVAEATEFAPASFDVVTAARCWHWLDRERAARELRRVLRPDGLAAICHFDRVGAVGDLYSETRALVDRANSAWAESPPQVFGHGAGVYPGWLNDLQAAGLERIECFSFDVDVPYSHEAWRGRVRSSGGVGGSLSAEEVNKLDSEIAELLAIRFPEEPVIVTQRLFCVTARNPA
jgi:ubiquinone/menaquinone biosynthesis C-methylase UbiE